jgi:arsenate reductase
MLPMKQSVLFVCIHNSARSQMAEAFVNRLCPEFFEAESAGLEAGTLNPLVAEAMSECRIDIAGKATRETFDLIKAGRAFDWVITVCDAASAERCPLFPGKAQRLNWSFPDPSQLAGTHDEKLARIREIRDAIRAKVAAFCEVHCNSALA